MTKEVGIERQYVEMFPYFYILFFIRRCIFSTLDGRRKQIIKYADIVGKAGTGYGGKW